MWEFVSYGDILLYFGGCVSQTIGVRSVLEEGFLIQSVGRCFNGSVFKISTTFIGVIFRYNSKRVLSYKTLSFCSHTLYILTSKNCSQNFCYKTLTNKKLFPTVKTALKKLFSSQQKQNCKVKRILSITSKKKSEDFQEKMPNQKKNPTNEREIPNILKHKSI